MSIGRTEIEAAGKRLNKETEVTHTMKLDKTFIRDIKKIANGDGGADHRKAFRQTIKAANAELSSPTVRERYSECISKYGRVPVAICTAVTIIYRQDRLEWRSVRWAQEVLKCWTNRPHTDLDFAYINDGLHPSRIEEYAAGLMSVTTEAAE